MKHRHAFECCLIFCFSLLLFMYGIGDHELVAFETRFGVFVQEMLRYGPSFFPTTYHLPYPDYPGLQTFLIYLLCLPFGKLVTWCAILPSALASSATLVLLYLILKEFDRRWAYAAILMTLLTYQFLDAARSLTMDSLIMTVTLWAFYCACKMKTKTLWCALILGFAIRGPIGLIIPVSVVGVTWWNQYSFKRACIFSFQAIFLCLILLAVLLLLAYHQAGSPFVQDVLRMQIFGRMDDHTQTHHFFDYFTQSFANYALSFEIALITLFVFRKKIFQLQAKTPETQLLRQCVFWILIIMIGMSIPNVRKIRYIMPIIPALAIIASYGWCQFQTRKSLLKSLMPLCIIAAIFWIVYVFVVTPLEIKHNHTKPFTIKLLQQLPAENTVAFFQMNPDGTAIQFLYAADLPTPPKAVQSIDWQHDQHTWFLTSQKIFDSQNDYFKKHTVIVMQDKLGHQPMVVFSVNPSLLI